MMSRTILYAMVIAILGYAYIIDAACTTEKRKYGEAVNNHDLWKTHINVYIGRENWRDTTEFDIAEPYFTKMKSNLYQATITRCVNEWNFIASKVHHGQQYDTDYNFQETIYEMMRTCDSQFDSYLKCTENLFNGGYCSNNACKF